MDALDEEVDKGIPIRSLLEAGAEKIGFADYLKLDGKIYEPVKWGTQRIDDHVNTVPTHYRERHMPLQKED